MSVPSRSDAELLLALLLPLRVLRADGFAGGAGLLLALLLALRALRDEGFAGGLLLALLLLLRALRDAGFAAAGEGLRRWREGGTGEGVRLLRAGLRLWGPADRGV